MISDHPSISAPDDIDRLAARLDDDADRLDRILSPLLDLHTVDTWDGAAARRSRSRLHARDDDVRRIAARLRWLADELRAHAHLRRLELDVLYAP